MRIILKVKNKLKNKYDQTKKYIYFKCWFEIYKTKIMLVIILIKKIFLWLVENLKLTKTNLII